MSKIKLYIDEDASREAFVNALRHVKIDCVTTLADLAEQEIARLRALLKEKEQN